jgi:hypothetical protein
MATTTAGREWVPGGALLDGVLVDVLLLQASLGCRASTRAPAGIDAAIGTHGVLEPA